MSTPRPTKRHLPSSLAVLVVGAAVGVFLAASYLPWPETTKPTISPAILGAAAALGGATALALQEILRRLAVLNPRLHERLTRIRIGGAQGTQMTIAGVSVSLGDDELAALWPVYVQLSTRITSNSLQLRHGDSVEHTGSTKAAFESLRSLFEVSRAALASCPPAGMSVLTRAHPSASEMVMSAINQCVRPFLARWHPWLDQWTATGLPERRWPGYEDCRADLDEVRERVRGLVVDLAGMYNLEPPPAQNQRLRIPWSGRADALDWGWSPAIEGAYAKAQHLLASRVPTEPALLDRRWLSGIVLSWAGLASNLEGHLAEMGAIPPKARLRPGEVRPDLRVRGWRQSLDRVLLRWQARTTAWDDATPEEIATCQADVEGVRRALRAELEALAPAPAPPA